MGLFLAIRRFLVLSDPYTARQYRYMRLAPFAAELNTLLEAATVHC